jgi:hypothetical protein
MKKLIVLLAIVLLPASCTSRNTVKYQDQVEAYEEAYPEDYQRNMMKHYYRWPTPPKR